jgi:alpha/beta superfamily hydrolase
MGAWDFNCIWEGWIVECRLGKGNLPYNRQSNRSIATMRHETFLLPGPAGDLEARLTLAAQPRQPPTVALVCHPHPLYGGTLDNKVAYMLASSLAGLGAHTLRFNFRGVGRSAGQFDHGEGETEDLYAAADWLCRRHGPAELWLAGFSFGAYVALRGHRQLAAKRLVLVAPPVARFDFGLALAPVPVLVIQGRADNVVAPAAVDEWIARQPRPPAYRLIDQAGHFFHGQLPRLREEIKTWVEQ